MSIKENFEAAFGSAFVVHDPEDYPDHLIGLGASRHLSLSDAEKFAEKEGVTFEPFSFLLSKADYFMYDEKWGLNGDYLRKAVEILKPNEYCVVNWFNKWEKEIHPILVLSNKKFAIAIAPRVFDGEGESEEWKVEKFESCLKKVAKSPFAL